ncbi:MAG: metallophosphoesterase [Cyclobacteriaceae bacterium]
MTIRKYSSLFLLLWVLCQDLAFAQDNDWKVSAIHPEIYMDEVGLYLNLDGRKVYEAATEPRFTLEQMLGNPVGNDRGIALDFQSKSLGGLMYYGFIPYADTKYPQPVYFRSPAKIDSGKAVLDISVLANRYDMIGWEKTGKGVVGYRVIDDQGRMLYDGRIYFKGTGPFEVDAGIFEGPSVNLLGHDRATIAFRTNVPLSCQVTVNGKTFSSKNTKDHEIEVKGLKPETLYEYEVQFGDRSEKYTLKTAPKPGEQTPFVFSYASDSRNGNGGGERSFGGANAYIMKKIMAMNVAHKADFMQFTGDLINGYQFRPEEIILEYANWKRAIEPFTHHIPIYTGMGNHEALSTLFHDPTTRSSYRIDKLPYDKVSAEKVFADEFVLPTNGPVSEDGASYDPDRERMDFPPYKENVYFYTHGNVAMVVLNSNYWFVTSPGQVPLLSGNPHAYIMDVQLEWFRRTIRRLERDKDIEHIFVTNHTPCFPNGGHVSDDMWYNGNNDIRPYVAGKPVEKGIIERRDELLDIMINQSQKVRAILTGDEHNYCKTHITPDMPMYPDNYPHKKLELSRAIYQVNNGAAGAPYYAQEQTPWTANVTGFTTQNALVFFYVAGRKINMKVYNPDTFELLDELDF